MKLNDKNIASFAVCSSPVDKEGYLQKKGDQFQRRWFVLKGNLLFYFQKKQDKEPLGVVVLEACSVQVSSHARYAFEIAFDGQGTRTYVLAADNDEEMQAWMKAISHASYEYLRSIVNELQRRVNLLTSSSQPADGQASGMTLLHVGPSKMLRTPHRTLSEKLSSRGVEHSSSGASFGGGGGPIAPKVKSGSKVTVRNGILVDIDDDEDAPPIPLKKKSLTVHSPSRRPPGGGAKLLITVNNTEDVEEDPLPLPRSTTIRSRPIHYLPSQQPHSSPLVPAVPLKDSSGLDRTPVLQPMSVSPTPSPSSDHAATPQSSVYPPPRPSRPEPYQNGGVSSILVLSDSSSSTSSVASIPGTAPSRQTTAGPTDNKKSVFEMHHDFTQAMEALKSERTS